MKIRIKCKLILVITFLIIVSSLSGCTYLPGRDDIEGTSSDNEITDKDITKEMDQDDDENQVENEGKNNINDLAINKIINNENSIGPEDGTFKEITLVDDKLWYIEDGYISTFDINTKEVERLKKLEGASDNVYNPPDSTYYTGENIWFYNYVYSSKFDMFYGLARYNFNEDKFYEYNDADISPISIVGILETENNLWFSTYGGLEDKSYYLNLENGSIVESDEYVEYFNDVVKNDNFMWFSRFGKGIVQVDNSNKISEFTDNNYLISNRIKNLSFVNNLLWIDWVGGVSVLDISKNKWHHISFEDWQYGDFNLFIEDDSNNLWIIGDENVINLNKSINQDDWETYTWDTNGSESFRRIFDVDIFNDFILVGSDKGLFIVDNRDETRRTILEEERILEIIVKERICFVSTNMGVYELELKQ
ncbi:MAG: hypothetical protein FH761_05905 [Firmicutes bacterium]|nr:hypothetical protein [Bacillota bacterium]